jgi:hypothetical protein
MNLQSGGGRADSLGVKPRVRRQISIFSLVLVAFGLLLWARLVLVTGHPRTATADPQAPEAAGSKPAER